MTTTPPPPALTPGQLAAIRDRVAWPHRATQATQDRRALLAEVDGLTACIDD